MGDIHTAVEAVMPAFNRIIGPDVFTVTTPKGHGTPGVVNPLVFHVLQDRDKAGIHTFGQVSSQANA